MVAWAAVLAQILEAGVGITLVMVMVLRAGGMREEYWHTQLLDIMTTMSLNPTARECNESLWRLLVRLGHGALERGEILCHVCCTRGQGFTSRHGRNLPSPDRYYHLESALDTSVLGQKSAPFPISSSESQGL